MRNRFFTRLKKTLSASTAEARSTAVMKNPGVNPQAGIQLLAAKAHSAVAGGPQVENDPQL